MTKFLTRGRTLLVSGLTTATLMSGCGSSSNDFVFTNTGIQPAPIAVNDAFEALGNSTVNQAATGVLANDTVNGAVISDYDAIGSQGGSIVLNPDGSFSYTPVFGFVGPETFGYTLSNSGGASKATVTMTSTGLGYFVDNTAAPDGNGSQAAPFDTLLEATDVAQSGDTIFVARGNGTQTGLDQAISLPAGVDLVGEGTGLILTQVIVPQGLAPSLRGPITCGGDNTVSGLIIDGSPSDGIIIDGVADVTVSNNTIENPTTEHINCDNAIGILTIDGNTLNAPSNTNQSFISSFNLNSDANVIVTNNIFTNSNNQNVGSCISVAGANSDMTVDISSNVANGTLADQFELGIYLEVTGTGQLTATVQDNTLNNFSGSGIVIGSTDANALLNGTVSGNTISNATLGATGITNGTLNFQENVITGCSDSGIRIDTLSNDGGTVIASNNNISDCTNAALQVVATGTMAVAVRDNSMLGNGLFSLVASAENSANLCLEVTGNTVDDDMYIDTYDVNANIDLENGAEGLETVNDFESGMPIINQVGTGTVTNRDPGFCNIP